MNSTVKTVSLIALAVAIVPSVFYFLGLVDAATMKWIALAGTIAWFVVTPMWMGREDKADATQVEN